MARAYLDEDGFVYVVDRVKDMIISGGENVYSAEVENALAQHPAVAQCAVIGIPSERWGEQVHAVVVLKGGASATAEELSEFSKTLIAGYKCRAASTLHRRRCHFPVPARSSNASCVGRSGKARHGTSIKI